MKKILSRGLAAATLATAVLAAPALAGPTVTIRVEGETRTLLAKTSVTLNDSGAAAPGMDASSCPANTVAGAIEKATRGDWNREAFVKTILGERHAWPDDPNESWFGWVNGKYGSGVCNDLLSGGEEVLMIGGTYDISYNPEDLPLSVKDVPARVDRGMPFTVTVHESQPDRDSNGYFVSGTGHPKPAVGATVTAGSVSATVGSDGKATLTLPETGTVSLQAHRGSKPSRSEPVTVCVSNGQDGTCATTKPSEPAPQSQPQPAPAPACETDGKDGRCGTVDRQPPKALITAIAEQQVFAKGKGPRELKGVVGSPVARLRNAQTRVAPDPSGILMVKLRLTRNDRGTCQYFSGRSQKLRRNRKGGRCGAKYGYWFKIGDRAEWSYLLPERLPRGRYVLDVNAIDKAYNRDDRRRRGENRVVFHVR